MFPKRAGRLVYALLVVVLLLIIGRNVYHRYLNSRLIAAVKVKNVTAVRALLARGADPNSRLPPIQGPGTQSPVLALAVSSSSNSPEQEEIACLLLQRGAAPNLDSQDANNDLLMACRTGSPAIVRGLLEHGAKVNQESSLRSNAVAEAIRYATDVTTPNIAPAEWSDSQRIQVEADKKQHRAAGQEMVRILQEHGAKLSLWQAARDDDIDALRAALDVGTAIDTPHPLNSGTNTAYTPKGSTALILAAQAGSIRCVYLLLDRGANVNAVNADTYSPLTAAIREQHLEIARLLLQRGAKVNSNVNSPLVAACASLPQLVPELLQRGTDMTTVGDAALAAAIQNKRPELVPLLLKHGANVRGKSGAAALSAAIQYQPELVPMFLAQGADARETGETYPRLIAQAARYKRKNLIVPLMRAGAKINYLTGGYTGALSMNAVYARSTPLIEALAQGADMVELLLQQGADPNLPNSQGETPLIVAAQSGDMEAARLLLAHKAAVNGEGTTQHTPLYYARRHKNADIAAILQQAGGQER